MSFINDFKNFLQEPFVISDEGTETKRARDEETKEKIEHLYEVSGDTFGEFDRDLESGRFTVIEYDEMEFSTNNIYITHKNEFEDLLYRDKRLASLSYNEDDLIPKGSIASKPPKDFTKYPILSQEQAERLKSRAYYQLANVGSCTRYQGSECRSDQTLYYLISQDSHVTNREWYTVVSRCWKLDSIVIVIIRNRAKKNLVSFKGKKVKPFRVLSIIAGVNDHEENTDN